MVDKKNKEQKGDKKMKKSLIKLIMLVILTFATKATLVQADILTLDELSKQLESSEIYKYLEESEYGVGLTTSKNEINVNYSIIESDSQNPVVNTFSLSYDDVTDILSYEYNGIIEDNEITLKRFAVEGLIISQIVYIIAENNGVVLSNDIDETKLTLEENGIEMEMLEVKSGNETVKGYKSLSVKLNDLNFENQNSESESDNNQIGSDNNEDVENPKTGNFISIVALIIAAIISIFIIVIANKKTVFKKI